MVFFFLISQFIGCIEHVKYCKHRDEVLWWRRSECWGSRE